MYSLKLIKIWIYITISFVIGDPNEKFGLEIPAIQSVQEAFKSFEKEPKIENITEIGEELLRSASKHVGEVKTISGKCVPDFSEPCPEGWEKIGELCKATAFYKGPCKTELSFESYTPEQKINWSNSCQANWPCKDSNKNEECSDSDRNKSKDSENYICVPDLSTYIGPCNSFVDFTDFTRESKRLWADSCGTKWPCMRHCSFVFEECPLDWVKEPDGSCSAPPSYKGSCDRTFHFTHYTQKMKLEYMKNCDIAFECTNDCKKDYNKCPNNWSSNSNGTCTSSKFDQLCYKTYLDLTGEKPTDQQYNQNNDENKRFTINLNSLSFENKVLFESKCSLVNFPCTEQDEFDWSKPCPLHWNLIKDYCTPLYIDGNDDCKSKKVFRSEEEKRKWSSFCQIQWPKFNESLNEPEVITVNERKRLLLNGPIIHETGSVNIIRDTINNSNNKHPEEFDYSKNIKKLKKLQTALNM